MISLANLYPWFRLDALNSFVVLAIVFFSLLIITYSLKFTKAVRSPFQYYFYIILTALASIAVALANDLIVLVGCWGFLGFTLYVLVNEARHDTSAMAKKMFIIIGGTDAVMLLGIGIIYSLTGTFQMDQIKIAVLERPLLSGFAYFCIAIACFAKAGAMPFHSWIPDCAEGAPIPVVAYLPASLDKLLGIYLLARISLDLFILTPVINIILMLIGAVTIIAAVMMALIQHNMKRLLGYHAVSQVGYMVLGIGTGIPIGIAGGIFHMLNHAVYKSCLFLTAGNVEQQTKTTELNKLGGLAKYMPLTYISALVASLSISGVPPFNGFVSKWMVYQGLIAQFQEQSVWLRAVSIICLTAAMFGSGLTLASFMKLLHATYLGQRANGQTAQRPNEVSFTMWLPCIVLAGVCIVFGVLANQIPLKNFIYPAVSGVETIGIWQPGLSTMLIFAGLILGVLLFILMGIKSTMRQDAPYVGAEPLALEENRVTGTEFYNTIKEFGILKSIYAKAQKGRFDIYEQGKNLTFTVGRFFQFLHNGILPTYLVWTLLGMIVLFFVLVR
jgi:formate hydrogenlyase subunit 3/multisubunit Na+/H+ antiporter MnhD subunit